MNYQEATEFLFSQLPMYQRSGKAAYKANLDNTLALDQYFGHPHKAFRSIHIAGTNGKGSVSHLLASILQEAGYRCGLYTSPHLLDYRERIRLNGAPIPEQEVTAFVETHREIISSISPSFFEMTVALAFKYFADAGVEIAVVETGMGGRLDSTNILQALLTVITNISMDHSEFLGDTIAAIAREKGGIIKEGIPLVLGPMAKEASHVLEEMARQKQAELIHAATKYMHRYTTLDQEGLSHFHFGRTAADVASKEDTISYACGLGGSYQQENLITVLTAVDQLRKGGLNIPEDALRRGLARVVQNTGILGRWQILGANPRQICDTGHNPAGIAMVMEQIQQLPWKNLHLVWGMAGDKDLRAMLSILPKEASYYFCRASIPRALDQEELACSARGFGLQGESFASVAEAWQAALHEADPDDLVFAGGSTFVVADLLGSLGY